MERHWVIVTTNETCLLVVQRDRLDTWYSICNVSRCTPINLALTSKTPTASEGEISKITFLNLRREEEEHRENEWSALKSADSPFPLMARTNSHSFREERMHLPAGGATHWLGCRSSMDISTPFSCRRDAVYFCDTCLLFLALLSPGFFDSLHGETETCVRHRCTAWWQTSQNWSRRIVIGCSEVYSGKGNSL